MQQQACHSCSADMRRALSSGLYRPPCASHLQRNIVTAAAKAAAPADRSRRRAKARMEGGKKTFTVRQCSDARPHANTLCYLLLRYKHKGPSLRDLQIAIEGCCHGELDKIYATLQHLERVQNKKVDLLICCGDFQVCFAAQPAGTRQPAACAACWVHAPRSARRPHGATSGARRHEAALARSSCPAARP